MSKKIDDAADALIKAVEEREAEIDKVLDSAEGLVRDAKAAVDAWFRGDNPTDLQKSDLESSLDWLEDALADYAGKEIA